MEIVERLTTHTLGVDMCAFGGDNQFTTLVNALPKVDASYNVYGEIHAGRTRIDRDVTREYLVLAKMKKDREIGDGTGKINKQKSLGCRGYRRNARSKTKRWRVHYS